MTARSVGDEPRARDLLDEAVHLLRAAPLTTWLTYAAGVLPFLLIGLYFVFDMSRNAYADERCAPLSLALALGFVWMKLCQSSFARRLRTQLSGTLDQPWPPRQLLRVAASQAFLQATGLVILPIALSFFLVFPWAHAYYHNVTALAGDDSSVRSLHRRALQQTLKWPRQNFFVGKILFLLAFIVWFNWFLMLAFAIPQLLQILLGLEANAALSGLSGLQGINSSTLSLSVVLTYLVVDPIARAAYTLRVFHGEAVASGEDLLAEFAQLRTTAAKVVAVVLLGLTCGLGTLQSVARAQEAAEPAGVSITAAELDQAVDRVLARSEYAWRLPRERVRDTTADEEGWLVGFLRRVREMIRSGVEWIGNQIIKFLEWIFGGRRAPNAGGGGLSLPDPQTVGLLLLLAVAVVLVTVLLVARWKRRKQQATPVLQGVAVPDIAAEETLASALPENEWLRLAEDLLRRGELRLALRALHFAGLSYLSERGLVAIARFKSDRDYERELLRKAHALPGATAAFTRNVHTFERVWYGTHAATMESITTFRAALNELRGTA